MQHTFYLPNFINRKCNIRACILAVFWVLGLAFGALISLLNEDHLYSLMRTAVNIRVSIVHLLLIQIFPVLLSAIAVYYSIPLYIFFICIFKSVCLGFILVSLGHVFGNAGWLIRFLFMFSDTLTIPSLLLYWFKHISGMKHSFLLDTKCLVLFTLFVSFLEYFLVSPFFMSVIRY